MDILEKLKMALIAKEGFGKNAYSVFESFSLHDNSASKHRTGKKKKSLESNSRALQCTAFGF